jgi:N6-adenosine-specific RNA methylase IME4
MCIIATRGHPKRIGKGVPELIVAERREHSRKPDEAIPRIERLFKGPYLDVFARTDRGGEWTAWGNDIHHFAHEPALLTVGEAA